jgi:lipopolysaccharide heptosyltransferase II
LKSTQPDQIVTSGQTQYSKTLLDWSVVRRVLLVRLRSIGDTVLMTPCLTALKNLSPPIEVSVVSEPLSAPVLEDHPLVDHLIVAGPSIRERARLIARLRRAKFDVAFNMHGGTTATLLAAMSGARHTVGYRGYRQSWMLNARAPSPDVILGRKAVHSVEQQLALISWTGVPFPERAQLSLVPSPADRAGIGSRLAALGVSTFAVIAPAAAFEAKRWPALRFAAVADYLSRTFSLSSVVIAGPGQEQIAKEVCEAAQSKPIALTGLTLKELIALMALSRLYVGNDSGPMHIAAAMGRPLVVVFGPSNSTVWHPWTDAPYRVVEAGDGKEAAIERVSVEEALAAVEEVVKSAVAATNQAL